MNQASKLPTYTMRALEAGLYTDEYLEMVNTVLQGRYITATGAYCMGVVEGVVRTALQRMPTLYLMQIAANCSSVQEALFIAENWIHEEVARQGHGGRRKSDANLGL